MSYMHVADHIKLSDSVLYYSNVHDIHLLYCDNTTIIRELKLLYNYVSSLGTL